MTDSSPGSKYPGAKPPLAPKPSSKVIATGNSSSGTSQPSSLPRIEDYFSSSDSKTVTSHPLDESSDVSSLEYHKGLFIRIWCRCIIILPVGLQHYFFINALICVFTI